MHRLPLLRLDRGKLDAVEAIAFGLSLVLALALALSCWYLRIHSRMDVLAYRDMIGGHYHPIWKDLALRRVSKGDTVENLVRRHSPLRREDFGPYTHLHYIAPSGSGTIAVSARDGRLFAAHAADHFFFDTPEEWKACGAAYRLYWQQRMLESSAFRVHRVVKAGQDVFLARLIEHREIREDLTISEEPMQEYVEIYGADYVEQMRLMGRIKHELTVEVTEVLHGDLQVGAVLMFDGDNCDHARAGEAELVYLHVEDSLLIYPHSEGGEMYMTVPREALDWYQSLTADRVQEFETRCLAERAKRAR